MTKFITVITVLMLSLTLVGCSLKHSDVNKNNNNQVSTKVNSDQPIEGEKNNEKFTRWIRQIHQQFSDETPLLLPNKNFHLNGAEYVYYQDNNEFGYDLYRYTEFQILTREKHRNKKHVHSVHDLFLSYKKSKVMENPITLSNLAKSYHISLDVTSNNNNEIIYNRKLISYSIGNMDSQH